jgi:two-component system, OmpR family, response regulator
MQQRVLVVDDEESITELLAMALTHEGFDVRTAGDGREAMSLVNKFRPDIIILDVQMPELDGFEVQRRLVAERARVPVLFLTARDAVRDKVHGLTLGADDYVTKPFSLEELLARVRSILRRTADATSAAGSSKMRFADLELDEATYQAWRGEQPIELTPREFALLRYLVLNAPQVLSKAQIVDQVWPYDFEGDFNVVETYISYLRRKVEVSGDPLIHTVRGFGYCLRSGR